MNRLVSKDLWSGIMFTGFGVLALVMGKDLAVGTAVRMGPGYVPRMLSYILIALGLAIVVRAIVAPGEPVERMHLKPIGMTTVGVVAFSMLFEFAGMAPATVALVFLSALGGEEFKVVETVLSSIVLTAICIVIFKLGLGMNVSVIAGLW